MEQFKIHPSKFAEIRKDILIKGLPSFVIVLIAMVAINYFNPNIGKNGRNSYFISIPLIIGVGVFAIYRGAKRQKSALESYTITIGEDFIKREQENIPDIVIQHGEIREISKNSNGSFSIKGSSSLNGIGIPKYIDRYDELEKMLNDIYPLTPKKTHLLLKYPGISLLLFFGLFGILYFSTVKVVAGVSGALLMIWIGYSIFVIQRSKNFSERTKRMSWFTLIILFGIAKLMYTKLIGS